MITTYEIVVFKFELAESGDGDIQMTSWWARRHKKTPEQSELCPGVERVMGIEPTYPAWEAGVLPLNYTRKRT